MNNLTESATTNTTVRSSGREDRVSKFAGTVIRRINETMADFDMTYEEYGAVKDWLIRVGEAGEWPLFLDVWFEHTVERLAERGRGGSKGTILGPYYLPDVPELSWTSALPQRPSEPGQALSLRGQVRSVSGEPLPSAVLDMWQADAQGLYSGFSPDAPDGNLRGRVIAGPDGRFDIQTVVPGIYEIPTAGPCGELVAAAGWSAWRPAHLHLIVSATGHHPLTTQLYFDGGEHIQDDIASAVKPELILHPQTDDGRLVASYDFVLDKE